MKPGPKPKPLKDRFFEKVDAGSDEDCWIWKGCQNGAGYGMILQGKEKRLAHRVSWEIARGMIPDGKIVLHMCDNAACVNPLHLALGTQRENMRDRAEKRRDNYSKPYAKLSPVAVKEIVDKYRSGATQKELGAEYGVSYVTVSQIIRGEIWTHVTRNLDLPKFRKYNRERAILTERSVIDIRKKYGEGQTQLSLAKEFGVSKAAIQAIVTRKNWKHI